MKGVKALALCQSISCFNLLYCNSKKLDDFYDVVVY